MKSRHRAAFAAIACALVQAAALSAQTQHMVRVGSFDLRLQADSATGEPYSVGSASLMPDFEPEGLVMWSCGASGLRITVELDAGVAQGDIRRVVWSFGQERLDSVWLERGTGPLWRVRDDQVARITALAKGAERMIIRAPGARGAAGTERAYELERAREVLNRLSCARDTSTPAWMVSPSERERELRNAPPNLGTLELSAVDVRPRLRNEAEITREIRRTWLPGMLEAGIDGSVTLRFRVFEDGRVDPFSVQVTDSDHEALDDPATELARRMVFTPALKNGQPVTVWMVLPIRFDAERPGPVSATP